jgi:hypothetical protein
MPRPPATRCEPCVRKLIRVFEFPPEATRSCSASKPARTSRPLPKHQGEEGNEGNTRRQHERLSAPERHALTILVRAAVASLIKER